MRVLITGAHGQVGRALLAAAPAHVEIVAMGRAELDIGMADAVADAVRQHRPDVIINAAAYTAVDRAESEPEIARVVNELGPKHLADAARETGARLIHVSTDFVFDGRSSLAYAPDAAPNPLNVYGATKLAGERAVQAVLPERSVVLRTAWVYTAEGRNFVRTMLRLMQNERTVRVVTDQIGTPTAAHSVAQVLWRLAESPALRGIYHWTDAGVASWYDFAVAIAEEGAALGLVSEAVEVLPISTEEFPTPARRPRFSVLDKRATASATGMTPCHWRRNLRRVLREMRHA